MCETMNRAGQLFAAVLIAIVISSCATGAKETGADKISDLAVSLVPSHKPFNQLNVENQRNTEIIDNDGNLYVTNWTVTKENMANFEKVSIDCLNSAGKWLFLNPRVTIDAIHENEIKPSNYKAYISCILDRNYKLISSEGFFPHSYMLQLSRIHATGGEYMPVGASIHIQGSGMQFNEVFTKLKSCVQKARESKGSSVVEERFRGYIYVSIEAFIESVMVCTTGKPYQAKKS